MQIIISNTLFQRAAKFNKKMEVLSRLLKTLDVKEVKETSWREIVTKIEDAGGTLIRGGMTVFLEETIHDGVCLAIIFDDDAVIEGFDLYEDFLADLVPVVLGFVASIKSLCRVFETRLVKMQKRWDKKAEKASKS